MTACRRNFHIRLARQSMVDGTIFLEDAEFYAISGMVTLHWYWSGPAGSGEKHAQWRC